MTLGTLTYEGEDIHIRWTGIWIVAPEMSGRVEGDLRSADVRGKMARDVCQRSDAVGLQALKGRS